MKMKILLHLALMLVASYIGALVWWRAWMYQGLVGPLPILHWISQSDGEGSYSKTEIEMFLHISAFAIIGYSLLVLKKNVKMFRCVL